jgi:NAD(P) transhydrogenase
MSYDFDLLAIGSGPAGQKAAIQAAKLGRRAAVVERGGVVGGVCVATGTIPSKTLREAVLYLTGWSQKAVYGQSYRVKEEITIEDLRERSRKVIGTEVDVIQDQLVRNRVALLRGHARFLDEHTLAVTDEAGSERRVTAETVVIGTGSHPARPPNVEFDGRSILDSDQLLDLDRLPGSVVVVGAGVIGVEYASMFAALRARVTLVDARPDLLEFCDGEVVEALRHHLRELGVVFRLGERVTAVEPSAQGTMTTLESGKKIMAEAVLYSAGRQGATDGLDLENAGLAADERGRVVVDEAYRTAVPNIYAAGDVIGFPALASTSMEQGRLAAANALGIDATSMRELMPIGLYSVPEISFVGKTEAELTAASVPYEVGVARYRELARGQILGDAHGMLKLLVSLEDRELLGVHAFGTGATELVHIGQAVMAHAGTVDFLVETVFNYPTLAEAYKVAALDAVNKMRAISAVG